MRAETRSDNLPIESTSCDISHIKNQAVGESVSENINKQETRLDKPVECDERSEDNTNNNVVQISNDENKTKSVNEGNSVPHSHCENSEPHRLVSASDESKRGEMKPQTPDTSSESHPSEQSDKSHNIQTKLEEVRQGIYRLLSESDDGVGEIEEYESNVEIIDTRKRVVKEYKLTTCNTIINTEVRYEKEITDDGMVVITNVDTPDCEDNVDHTAVSKPGYQSRIEEVVEAGDREEKCTDSGIERGLESSRGGSAEGWLTKLSHKIGDNNNLGTGGQSALSEASHHHGDMLVQSLRDGGFAEIGLGLQTTLAQAEEGDAEFPNQTVQNEMNNEGKMRLDETMKENHLEEENVQLKREIQQLTIENENNHIRMQRSRESQNREVVMVNKLQVSNICNDL